MAATHGEAHIEADKVLLAIKFAEVFPGTVPSSMMIRSFLNPRFRTDQPVFSAY
jgi:hypothetical protein